MTELELIEAACKEKTVNISFQIPTKTQQIAVTMSIADRIEIENTQETFYNMYYADYCEKGMDARPVNPLEIEKQRESIKTAFKDDKKKIADRLKRFDESLPENLADQLANKHAIIQTVQKVIPKFLKAADGSQLLKTKDEQDRMTLLIKSDPDLFTLLFTKYNELYMATNRKIEEQVKNLQKQEGSKSGQ